LSVLNIYEAKTHLSELIRKVLNGDEVIIAKAGKPLVRIIPYIDKEDTIKFGLLKGKIQMAEDFDEFSPELEDMFKNYLPE
jgi:prevent-host-death family protein